MAGRKGRSRMSNLASLGAQLSAGRPMTSRDVEMLMKVIRSNAKVAKAKAVQRSAELRADFEKQISAIYSFDQDEVWAAAEKRAEEAVQKAKAEVATRCRELGIPAAFAPNLSLGWYGRGENAVASRRAELRKLAIAQIAELEKTAIAQIEERSAEIQTKLVSQNLTTEAAKTFLTQLPPIEVLMPPVDVKVIEARLGTQQDE